MMHLLQWNFFNVIIGLSYLQYLSCSEGFLLWQDTLAFEEPKYPHYWGGSMLTSFLLSSRIDFNADTKIAINNQQSTEIINGVILDFRLQGDGESP